MCRALDISITLVLRVSPTFSSAQGGSSCICRTTRVDFIGFGIFPFSGRNFRWIGKNFIPEETFCSVNEKSLCFNRYSIVSMRGSGTSERFSSGKLWLNNFLSAEVFFSTISVWTLISSSIEFNSSIRTSVFYRVEFTCFNNWTTVNMRELVHNRC